MQKRLLVVVFIMAILAAAGCKKLDNLLNFNVTYLDTVEVPPNPLTSIPLTFTSDNIATNSSSQFQGNNTSTNLVKHVYLQQLTLNIISPQGQTFGFLKSAQIFLYSPSLGATEVAYLDSVPAGSGNQLALEMTGKDIQNYIKLDSFAVQTTVVTSQTTSQSIIITGNSTFQVNASPF